MKFMFRILNNTNSESLSCALLKNMAELCTKAIFLDPNSGVIFVALIMNPLKKMQIILCKKKKVLTLNAQKARNSDSS